MAWSPKNAWSRGSFLRSLLIAPAAAIAACTGRNEKNEGTDAVRSSTTETTGASGGQAAATRPPSARQNLPPATSSARVLQATPACGDDDDDPTPPQTEGPYFTPNSPERSSLLEPGMPGRRLNVTGTVLTTDCRPVAGALIDFWQADDAGAYDNAGYRLRGHQFADADGRYALETVVPGLYPGRTRHIHVKVQAPNGMVLTTQQYFPDEPRNARDGIYRRELEMAVTENPDGSLSAAFDYVLAG